MAMLSPMRAQQLQGGPRQRHKSVFGALASMHMDHHPLAVDIGDLQVQRFLKA
jgi:hypothetical protein